VAERRKPEKPWHAFQVEVAEFFRAQGYIAEVDKEVESAKVKHKVDVLVSFVRNGIVCRWIVECKLWNTPVPKEKVLALQALVHDVGADRGLLFSKKGFQKGAQLQATYSNTSLVPSFDEFKRTSSMGRDRVNLVLRDSTDAPPVFAFPEGDQPRQAIVKDDMVFVANWGRGNVAIVDPKSKTIEATIALDKYERRTADGNAVVDRHPPGWMTVAGGKIFLGQVFGSDLVVIDIATQSIVKRIPVAGGGEGAVCASVDGKTAFFASNRAHVLFSIDTRTYEVESFPFPDGGRGCLCVLAHPTRPLVYLGIQRRTARNGSSPFRSGNSFLTTFDLEKRAYSSSLSLTDENHEDWGMPMHLLFDSEQRILQVGMFQSRLGLVSVDETGSRVLGTRRFEPNSHNPDFDWVDPIAQAIHGDHLLTINRNNRELVILNRRSLSSERSVYLGEAPNGPTHLEVFGNDAIVCYPGRGGLLFIPLGPKN
jgi:hypothetical protein